MASKHGNHEALAWIFEMWEKHGYDINIDEKDSRGYTSLMSACQRGYNSGSEESAARLQITKIGRLKTCIILIKNGADVNIQNEYVKMTALHWAAYNDDLRTT